MGTESKDGILRQGIASFTLLALLPSLAFAFGAARASSTCIVYVTKDGSLATEPVRMAIPDEELDDGEGGGTGSGQVPAPARRNTFFHAQCSGTIPMWRNSSENGADFVQIPGSSGSGCITMDDCAQDMADSVGDCMLYVNQKHAIKMVAVKGNILKPDGTVGQGLKYYCDGDDAKRTTAPNVFTTIGHGCMETQCSAEALQEASMEDHAVYQHAAMQHMAPAVQSSNLGQSAVGVNTSGANGNAQRLNQTFDNNTANPGANANAAASPNGNSGAASSVGQGQPTGGAMANPASSLSPDSGQTPPAN